MLTKQAREKIAERAREFINGGKIRPVYTIFTGDLIPSDTTPSENCIKMYSIILDLCDTSDMMELPRDKDDKVIHIGDMVWFEGVKETVSAIEMYKDTVYIHLTSPKRPNTFSSPNVLTHVDIISEYERIAQEIEEIAAGSSGTVIADDLRLVAEEIRELGDGND